MECIYVVYFIAPHCNGAAFGIAWDDCKQKAQLSTCLGYTVSNNNMCISKTPRQWCIADLSVRPPGRLTTFWFPDLCKFNRTPHRPSTIPCKNDLDPIEKNDKPFHFFL
jgi:hypothetical protein